jgi:hypothetical protein
MTRDHLGGVLTTLLGAGVIWRASIYQIGDLQNFGPGLFPAGLGVVLIALGLAILLRARLVTRAAAPRRRPEWRGWLCIIAGMASFVVIGQCAGLLPATFCLVFISALGDRDNSVWSALLLACAMVAICVIVFWWGLKVQFPLFRWS